MRLFVYRGDPLARRTPLGLHRYPSRIGWYAAFPGRWIVALHLRDAPKQVGVDWKPLLDAYFAKELGGDRA